MLEISCRNGSRADPLIGPKVISRSCQTEELAYSVPSAPYKQTLTDEISNTANGSFSNSHHENNPNGLLNGAIPKGSGILSGQQQPCLSSAKDKSTGNSKDSTSSSGTITIIAF